MTEITCTLEENLRTRGAVAGFPKEIILDGPKIMGGREEEPSPTDMLALCLGACVLTMMGGAAQKAKVDITGTTAKVKKSMQGMKLVFDVDIFCPHAIDPALQARLKEAGSHCPIHQAFGPNVEQTLRFTFG